MPDTVIRFSDEIRRLAQPLIREHHSELREARIAFLLTNAKRTMASKPLAAGHKKLSVEARFFSSGMESVEDGFDFVISINEQAWRTKSEPQRMALLDHELSYCGRKETVNRRSGKVTRRWVINPPDFVGFVGVIKRHGMYDFDAQQIVGAARQLDLPLVPPADEAEKPKQKRRRKTTTEADGVVVRTKLEPITDVAGACPFCAADLEGGVCPNRCAEKFVPYEERPTEELTGGHADGDWEPDWEPTDEEITEGEQVGVAEDVERIADEGLETEQPTLAGVAAQIDLERPMPEDLEPTPFDDVQPDISSQPWREAAGIGASEAQQHREARTRA